MPASFITLTDAKDGSPTYINVSHIVIFFKRGEGTHIEALSANIDGDVLESPDQILKLIKEARRDGR